MTQISNIFVPVVLEKIDGPGDVAGGDVVGKEAVGKIIVKKDDQ